MKRVWVFNFDADEELAAPDARRRPLTPPSAVRARLQAAEQALMGVKDCSLQIFLERGGDDDETVGAAWMPTPSALAQLQAAGVKLPDAPTLAVLQRVNARPFAHALGGGVHGTRWLTQAEELEQALDTTTTPLLLRQAHGFSGRGRLLLRRAELDAAAKRFVARGWAAGGLELAPWVEVQTELALHGMLTAAGALQLGQPVRNQLDTHGQWLAAAPCADGDLTSAERRALYDCAEAAAERLHTAGYFGPFGLDALRWRDAEAREHFAPCIEINARYTMSWALGMCASRTRGALATEPRGTPDVVHATVGGGAGDPVR